MNVIVTKNKVDYSNNFVKVSSLKEANEIIGTIDVLIYNNSSESSEDRIKFLGELKNKVKNKLVYICSESKVDLAVKMIIVGSDGKYFDDEFFLESPNELNNLISSLDEVTALAELGGISVLSDFFNRYLKNGSANFNSNYLMVVKEAVSDILSQYNQKNLEIIQMSETATDIFSNTSLILSKMKAERESMQEVVESMSNKIKEPKVTTRRSSVLFYPRVSYMNERSIIRIKEVGSFRYLVSFMLGFRSYLENVKNVRPKLIFFEPVGDIIESVYSDFSWVKVSNSKLESNYHHDVVFTNCPSKEVINKLLNDDGYDTFIVVDRTISDKEHILNCKGAPVKYAVSGASVISKFNLNKKSCITSITEMRGVLLTVPLFPEYPLDSSARERFYMSEMASGYDKLLLDLRRR